MATIVTDLSLEPIRPVPKPQRTERKRQKADKGLQRRSPLRKKQKRSKSALAYLKEVKHERADRTMAEKAKITPIVYHHISARCGGRCEMCGRVPAPGTYYDRLEAAHLIRRAKGG